MLFRSTCLDGIIREMQEECGIMLDKKDLQLKGSMHHFSGSFDYMNYIYVADLTAYSVMNMEPDKCEMWNFFPIDDLPSPMYDYIKYIITMTLQNNTWIVEYA